MLNKSLIKLKEKITLLEILFVMTLCLSFYTRIGRTYNVNYFIKIIIATLWTLLAFFKFFYKNEFKLNKIKNLILQNKEKFVFIVPIIGLIIYNFILVIFGQVESAYIGRMISNLYSMLIVVTFSLSSLYLFGKKSFRLMIYAIVINFFSLIIINMYLYGLDCFNQLYLSIIGNINAINGFEVHDLTFAVGIICIILFLTHRNKYFYLIISLIIMLFGFKRIQLLTMFICLIVYFILKLIPFKNKCKCMFSINILIITFSFIYIAMIKTGLLFQICNFLGIETMGRLTLYKWISDYFEISPLYFGLGMGSTFKMTELLTTWGIYALHSDILRMFVENGFIVFFMWLSYYLIYLPFFIKKNKKINTFSIYFFTTMYLFIIHFTDNTVLYFVTQYVYTLSILYLFKYENSIKLIV